MVLTTGFTLSRFSDIQAENAVPSALAVFQRLNVDDQLPLFWRLYIDLRCLVTPIAPSPVRLQQAEGLLNQVKLMAPAEQLQAIQQLIARSNTPVSRAYGVLSATTRLAFWYQLAECIAAGTIIPIGSECPMSASAHEVLQTIEQLDIGEQVSVLRGVVVNMGIDPLAL